MKRALTIIGILLALAGGVWFLQGIGVLPGSFMSNNPQWVIIGLIAVVIGVGLAVYSSRRQVRT
jgi:hypothetical protein